jgi:diaminobutyrate-2-oxoglutarate transaminase
MGLPLANVSRMPYDNYFGPGLDSADYLERMLADPSSGIDAPAAVLLETVQGEGGLNAARAPWLRRIADIARAAGALLIVDDVQAGCGRTGSFFSFEGMGFEPDLVVLSKSISGYGLPMALLLIRPQHDQWLPAEHNGTFRGNTHAFVTAAVAIEKYWSTDWLAHQAERNSALVATALREMTGLVPGSRRKGRGMMQGLDVGSGDLAAAVSALCFERGLIIETSGAHDEVLKVLAAVNTPAELLEEGLGILRQALVDSLGISAPAASATAPVLAGGVAD